MLTRERPSLKQAGIENIPKIEDESNLDFITGFPCNHYRCHGTLTEGGYAGQTAIVCSVCEDVYYLLADA